jgi:uncharacterized membrane protein YqjE
MLCQYKDLLGKVGEGIHSYRIYNIAIVDVLLTILGAFIIHLFLPKYRFTLILAVLFLLGIILHRIFCVKTTIDKLIFDKNDLKTK